MQARLYQVHDITGQPKTAETTFKLVNAAIASFKDDYPSTGVVAVVSDAASEARKARQMLVNANPGMLHLNCFAHQLNLLVSGLPRPLCCCCEIYKHATCGRASAALCVACICLWQHQQHSPARVTGCVHPC